MGRPRTDPRDVVHGTMAAYDWHIRRKVTVCDECRAAKRVKSKTYGQARRDEERAQEPRRAAWRRASGRLAAKYPKEFREILAEEMRGLMPTEQGDSDDDER